MLEGTKVTIEGEAFIIPPISLGQLRNGVLAKLQEHDKLVAEGNAYAAVDLRGQVILAALQRNYPDFPEAKLFDFLDMRNSGQLWLAVLGASGFTPGEGEAAKQHENGIFAQSTAA